MTDDETLTERTDEEDGGVTAAGAIDGGTAWPWLKDAALIVFLLFFGFNYLVVRSVGLDEVAGSGGAAGASSGLIEVSLDEFVILGDFTTSPGPVTLQIVNDGAVDHNVVIPDLGVRSANLKPGEEETLDLGRVSPRTYAVFCNLPGHRESGMETELVVSSS